MKAGPTVRLPRTMASTQVMGDTFVPRRPPALAVVLACARARRDAETTHRVRRLLGQGPVDWPLVHRLALSHGLLPLLSWQLEPCADLVPVPVMSEVRGAFQRNAARNVALTRELLRILSLLEAHRIPAIPYKGPVLARLAYGDVALRHFVDLDLLVHKRDVLPASRLLSSDGYRPLLPLTPAHQAAFLDQHCEYGLGRDRDGTSVELHWEIVPPEFGLPVTAWRLWDAPCSISLQGRTVLSPSPEDLLVILCVHGSKHLWNRLGWICDVAELIRAHPDLDWPRVLGRARAIGAARMLGLGLWLAADLLEAELPAAVRDGIAAEHPTRALATRIEQWLTDGTLPAERSLAMSRFHLAMRERLSDRIRYGRRLLFTGTFEDWEAVPLPRSLFFLYGVLRPLRLARKHWRTILGDGR